MAKKRTTSTKQLKLWTLVFFVVCMALPWLLSPSGCQLDTSPRILPHPPVESDDADSGEHDK